VRKRIIAALLLCFAIGAAQTPPETKEQKKQREAEYKEWQKKEKELTKQAASSIPSVEIFAPVDKVKALILMRMTPRTDFTLFSDSSYQLKFRRNAKWPSFWTGMVLESTSSRPTKEELVLTFVELQGKTTVSSEHGVVREGEAGNTQRDTTNHIGQWNLELQRVLDGVKRDLEISPASPANNASAPSESGANRQR